MMKKIFSVLTLFIPLTLLADKVSQEQARKIAKSFFSPVETRGPAPVLTLKWTGIEPTRSEHNPAFYVFDNSAGGFVVVSGDDNVEPILGYSTDGEFRTEGMPDHVKYWFDFLQSGILHLRANHFTPPARVKAQWKDAVDRNTTMRTATASDGSKLLNTALWGQGDPFNLKASEWCGFGEPVHTGCVATATAILMHYYRYPSHGVGSIGGYSYTSKSGIARNIRSYSLGHSYDWDNMPADNGRNWNDAQKNAVSQLMLDCGVMVEMAYGTYYSESGSSAHSFDVPGALVEHMGYDKSYHSLGRAFFQRDEWVNSILESIENGHPVFFSGTSEYGSSHAFILDGFDSDGRIHVNFGWGGNNNAFFIIPDFGEYKYDQYAYINIKPDEGGSIWPQYIYQLGMRYSSRPTINESAGTATMKVFTERVGNNGLTTFSGKICLAHADKEDHIKHIIEEINTPLAPIQYRYKIENTYTVKLIDIASGDKIKWYYQLDGSDEFLPVLYDLEDPNAISELALPETEGLFDIEKGTSAAYFPGEKTLVITSHSGLQYLLTKSNGSVVNTGTEFINGKLTINLTDLEPGTYMLTLIVGQSTKVLKFTL